MFEINDYEILCGNAVDKLKELPDKSVQVCITSPPYYGLRDYGTGKWVGGDPDCPHKRMNKYSEKTITGHAQEELRGNVGDAIYKTVCPLCGAVREDAQIGLEETPEEYIDRLVSVFREVKRVLKDDGTLWVNIGDSYAGGAGRWGGTDKLSDMQGGNKGSLTQIPVAKKWEHSTIKPKDLIGIPWMLAFALRADGWYLRQDIIWHKPNPMPESVEDRCTKSHEYIFLLSKSPKYYFDYEAIEEPANYDGRTDTMLKGSNKYADGSYLPFDSPQSFASAGHERWKFKPATSIKFGGTKYGDSDDTHFQTYSGNAWTPKYKSSSIPGVVRDRLFNYNSKRNNNPEAFMLDSTDPHSSDYKYLANTVKVTSFHGGNPREGTLRNDGDRKNIVSMARTKNCQYDGQEPNTMHLRREEGLQDELYAVRRKRDVWSINVASYKGAHFATFPESLVEPCILAGSKENDTVLDPFSGSGTTGIVALKHSRKYIGVELNPDYVELSEKRFDELLGVEEIKDPETGETKKIQAVKLF